MSNENENSSQSDDAMNPTSFSRLFTILFFPFVWFFGPLSAENAAQWLKVVIVAGGLVLSIRWILFEPYKIPSSSMEPTLHGDERLLRGDRIFVNKFVYGVRAPFTNFRLWRGREPRRWDVVVFNTVEENATHKTLVKRVVGLPGERIHIRDGKIWINGKPIALPPEMPDIYYTSPGLGYSTDQRYGVRSDDEHSLVPPGHYLVLGDNSSNSRDGRVFGWLPNENILGPVFAIWWPIARWRDLSGFTRTWWWRGMLAIGAVVVFVRVFIARLWSIHAPSKSGEFCAGDRLLVSQLSFGIRIPVLGVRLFRRREPERGELVLYRDPTGQTEYPILGRAAGFAGESISMSKDSLHINNARVVEPAMLINLVRSLDGRLSSAERSTVVIPNHHCFVISESDEDAVDSLVAGPIHTDHLIGAATRIWWPPSRRRRLSS